MYTIIFFDVLALQGRRSAIKTYLQEIEASVEETADEGVLDHTLAKLLPVVTTLCIHLDPPLEEPDQIPKDLDVTDKFAPTQKNEKQLGFEKVKSKVKTIKFPLK